MKKEKRKKKKKEVKKEDLTFNELASKAHLKKLTGELYNERERAYTHAHAAYIFIYGSDDLNIKCISDYKDFVEKYSFSPNGRALSLVTKLIELEIMQIDYSIQDIEVYSNYVQCWNDLYGMEYDIYQKVPNSIMKDFELHMLEIQNECIDDVLDFN